MIITREDIENAKAVAAAISTQADDTLLAAFYAPVEAAAITGEHTHGAMEHSICLVLANFLAHACDDLDELRIMVAAAGLITMTAAKEALTIRLAQEAVAPRH